MIKKLILEYCHLFELIKFTTIVARVITMHLNHLILIIEISYFIYIILQLTIKKFLEIYYDYYLHYLHLYYFYFQSPSTIINVVLHFIIVFKAIFLFLFIINTKIQLHLY